jgi:hypothetical protein
MDGVAYLVSAEGIILAVGERTWETFARENHASGLTAGKIIGYDFFSVILGDEVKDAYRKMHDKLRLRGDTNINFEYRCDSPDAERRMRMSMAAVVNVTGVTAILYQSQMLRETERVPMMLFSPENYVKTFSDDSIVSLCCYCSDVAWPIGAQQPDREWITPDAYYTRGGVTDVVLSHGICPDCFATIVTPNTL